MPEFPIIPQLVCYGPGAAWKIVNTVELEIATCRQLGAIIGITVNLPGSYTAKVGFREEALGKLALPLVTGVWHTLAFVVELRTEDRGLEILGIFRDGRVIERTTRCTIE